MSLVGPVRRWRSQRCAGLLALRSFLPPAGVLPVAMRGIQACVAPRRVRCKSEVRLRTPSIGACFRHEERLRREGRGGYGSQVRVSRLFRRRRRVRVEERRGRGPLASAMSGGGWSSSSALSFRTCGAEFALAEISATGCGTRSGHRVGTSAMSASSFWGRSNPVSGLAVWSAAWSGFVGERGLDRREVWLGPADPIRDVLEPVDLGGTVRRVSGVDVGFFSRAGELRRRSLRACCSR